MMFDCRTRSLLVVVTAFVMTAGISIALYRSLSGQRTHTISEHLTAELDRLVSRMSDRLMVQRTSILRMSRRYERGNYHHAQHWRADAASYFEHFPHLRAIGLRDAASKRDWNAGESTLIPTTPLHEALHAALVKLEDRSESDLPVLGELFRVGRSGVALRLTTVLHGDNGPTGTLTGAFDYAAIMEDIIKHEQLPVGFIRIEDEQFGEVYTRSDGSAQRGPWEMHRVIELDGRPISIHHYPSAEQLRHHWSALPELCLGFGLLLGLALSSALGLWMVDRTHKNEIMELSRSLERERERFERAVRGSMDGMWDWNIADNSVWVSPRWYELLRMDESLDVTSADTMQSLVHPEDLERISEAVNDQIKNDTNLDIEIRLRTGDQSYRWYRVKGCVARDENGRALRISGSTQDIHDRKETRDTLNEQRRLLQSILYSMNEGVVVAGVDRTLLHFNPAASRITGCLDADTTIDTWPERIGLFDPETGRTLKPEELPINRALQGEEVNEVDIAVQNRAVGGRQLLLCSSAPIRDESGALVAGVMVFRDVTIERQYQQRLQEANEELEQFAYIASHDLKEPLRTISSYLQLLERRYADHLDEDAREFVQFAVDGADRMRQLIQDLLQLSRVTSTGGTFQTTSIDEVVREAIHDIDSSIQEHNVQISVSELPSLSVDRGQLRRVFQNLIENAIKFRGTDRPRIEVRAVRRASDWLFSVSDNGIGLDQKLADRIFVIFKRLHTREEYPGTGMGLAICKKIVERHGGSIWVESKESAGSTFYFTVPIRGDTEFDHEVAA